MAGRERSRSSLATIPVVNVTDECREDQRSGQHMQFASCTSQASLDAKFYAVNIIEAVRRLIALI